MSCPDNNTAKKQQTTAVGLPKFPEGLATFTSRPTSLPSKPVFRSVSMVRQTSDSQTKGENFEKCTTMMKFASVRSDAVPTPQQETNTSILDSGPECRKSISSVRRTNWRVNDNGLRPVPPLYPLEKSSRCVVGTSASVIAARISECCRLMSVQSRFYHDAATASLRTMEHVGIEVSLWRGKGSDFPPGSVIVEAQWRSGDAIIGHRYRQNILNAAEGFFDAEDFAAQKEREKSYVKLAEHMLAGENPRADCLEQCRNCLLALEIVASLLKKDRMDAQHLGMENLCLLTDPARSGMQTALTASCVVLTGNVQDESTDLHCISPEELGIREMILSLVHFGQLVEGGPTIDEGKESGDQHPEEQDHNDLMHNLGLTVLANSLDMLGNHGKELTGGGQESVAIVADAFLSDSREISSRDVLSTLLNVLSSAGDKTHDACLSARCLRSLCEASADAKKCSRNLNANHIVTMALDVGKQKSARLEIESERALAALHLPHDVWQE